MNTNKQLHRRARSTAIKSPLSFTIAGSLVLMVTFAQTAAAQQVTNQQSNGLEEIIVTATKRAEAVRDISASVTAITGDQLEQLGAQSFADYLTSIPGIVLNAETPGLSPVVIRGVSTTVAFDQGQATTKNFINERPFDGPQLSTNRYRTLIPSTLTTSPCFGVRRALYSDPLRSAEPSTTKQPLRT